MFILVYYISQFAKLDAKIYSFRSIKSVTHLVQNGRHFMDRREHYTSILVLKFGVINGDYEVSCLI